MLKICTVWNTGTHWLTKFKATKWILMILMALNYTIFKAGLLRLQQRNWFGSKKSRHENKLFNLLLRYCFFFLKSCLFIICQPHHRYSSCTSCRCTKLSPLVAVATIPKLWKSTLVLQMPLLSLKVWLATKIDPKINWSYGVTVSWNSTLCLTRRHQNNSPTTVSSVSFTLLFCSDSWWHKAADPEFSLCLFFFVFNSVSKKRGFSLWISKEASFHKPFISRIELQWQIQP